jgi:hypothetical protein
MTRQRPSLSSVRQMYGKPIPKKMSAAHRSKNVYRWRISRIRGTPAVEIDTVEAADAEQAIQVAIKEFEISDPEQQKRLAARRVG